MKNLNGLNMYNSLFPVLRKLFGNNADLARERECVRAKRYGANRDIKFRSAAERSTSTRTCVNDFERVHYSTSMTSPFKR